ncbi:MAG TPA: D-alanyl-D-alanine carboxypeptidase/D-alanyl-D-alanine-endopeptidase [Pyrinomonadaceae bacterium]|nr:D-alanyl-D-alanine carboxypeptidase/D-alanyl-D-alanine-endopeptidase [Pyrinomonadaceae bacterium]
MKKISQIKFALFLIAAIGLSVAAQSDNRQRIIVGGTPTPTPTVSPTPNSNPQCPPGVPCNPRPSPTPNVSPTPAISGGQTIFDLQAKIRQSLMRPELQRGTVGIKITSLDTGKVVFEENAEKYLMPASNMKSFTVAAALEKLSPNFRFITSVFAPVKPDASGTVKGDLSIYGRGDISVSTAFYSGDYYKGLDNLADKIVAAGVKRIEGNLVGDESYFTGNAIPISWEWDDLQWNDGAEISALPLNDNALDLTVKPGSVGAPCVVQLLPLNPVMRVVNTCVTTASNVKRDLTVKKDLDQNVVVISGTMPAGDKGFTNYLTVSHPSELFVALLKQRLEQKGVVVTGQPRVIGAKEKAILAVSSMLPPVQIATLESPPFSVIAAKTMKPSQNMYTETILWTLGQEGRGATITSAMTPDTNPFLNPKATSSEKGIFVVRNFLNEIGIAPDGIIQYDGSGLSRHNLVTPAALIQLYTYMAKQSRYADVWYDVLPVGGVDGTLRSRFSDARTNGNVHAKTGTLDQVSALSGYVTSAAGEKMVFSIIVNGVKEPRARTGVIDEIVRNLANFNGRIN